LAQHPEDPSIVYAGLGAVSRGRSADATQKGHGDLLVSTDQGETTGIGCRWICRLIVCSLLLLTLELRTG